MPTPHEASDPVPRKGGVSRRGFLKGAGLTAAGTMVLDAGLAEIRSPEAAPEARVLGPGPVPVTLRVNGRAYQVSIEPRMTLADVLRNGLYLTGTKVVCDRGACSACTVWLDKQPVCACLTLAIEVTGREFAIKQLMDELAEKLGMDPLVLRDKNDKLAMRREQRRVGAERFGWKDRKPPALDAGPVKRGVGMAQAEWARFADMNSSCQVRLTKDGSVKIISSVQDLGTGIRTVLAQVVAEELGLKVPDITVRIGDTMYPAGPGSGGSKTTGSITPAARNAAFGVKNQLLAGVAPKLGAPVAEQISSTASRTPDYGGGVQFAQVSVDTQTGFVHVDRVVAVHDCGRPMNPLQIESQINGGILQGISWALYENRHLDHNSGWMVNTNLDQYKILLSRETPEIEVILLEEYTGRSSTDAMGVAEPANISTAAAVANAVYNAIGVRIYELPITPDRILAALARKPVVEPNKARKP